MFDETDIVFDDNGDSDEQIQATMEDQSDSVFDEYLVGDLNNFEGKYSKLCLILKFGVTTNYLTSSKI